MPTNLLNSAGTNGFIQAPIDVMTTELDGLAGGAAATSSVNGSSGVFTQTNFASASWLSAYFISGGTFTPVVGQCLYGWFLLSPDGGSTFEAAISTPSASVMAVSRSPDFIIPLDNAAYASGNIRYCQGRFIKSPWESCKLIIQNLGGLSPAALPSSGNKIRAGGVAIQF